MSLYLTTGQAARKLRVSVSTLKRWLVDPEIQIAERRNGISEEHDAVSGKDCIVIISVLCMGGIHHGEKHIVDPFGVVLGLRDHLLRDVDSPDVGAAGRDGAAGSTTSAADVNDTLAFLRCEPSQRDFRHR